MIKYQLLFFWTTLLLVYTPADTLLSVASVLQTKTINNQTLDRFIDLLNAELNKTSLFEAIDRIEVANKINVNDISISECQEASCFSTVGKSLGTAYLIYGTIDKSEGLYGIELNALNITKATIFHTVDTSIPLDREYLLVQFFKDFIKAVAQKKEGAHETFGKLKITSSPENIGVFIDDDSVGVTPFLQEDIETGSYIIRLVKYGYKPVKEKILIKVDELVAKQYTIERTEAWLDSVENARKAAHKDSMIQVGRKIIKKSLPEMYLHLIKALPVDSLNTIAILPFNSTDTNNHSGKMAAEYGIVFFSQNPGFRVVERANLKQIMEELNFSRSDLVAEDKVLKTGELLSAQYIVTGTVTKVIPKTIVFSRLIHVETGEIVSAASAEMKTVEMDEFYRHVFGEKIKPTSALFRSTVLPGWGQFYTDKPAHGIISLTLAAAGAGILIWSVFDLREKDAEVEKYKNNDITTVIPNDTPQAWAERANKAVDDKNNAVERTNIIIAGLCVAWVGNMIDAFILGNRKSKELKNLYFSCIPELGENGPAIYAGIKVEF